MKIHKNDELLQALGGKGAYAFDRYSTYKKLSKGFMKETNKGVINMPEDEYKLLGEATEGKITAVGSAETVETKFGSRNRIPLTVELESGDMMDINIWVSATSHSIRPNSNTGRLLKKCKVTKLSELVGKKVPLRIDTRGFHRFDV